jgi:ribose transport system ATP-binding protein
MPCAPSRTGSDAGGLRATGIVKTFGRTAALAGVDFEVRYGEVMGLVGPNGAGKSTLVKILAGFESPDAGEITIDPATGSTGPGSVAVAHQELSLIPSLTVAENLFLGDRRQPLFRSKRHLARKAIPHLVGMGLMNVDPMEPVASLSIGQRYLVEVARMLARDATVLFVDEPTAALSDSEAAHVLDVLRGLADSGCAVVLVTHRLDEVMAHADRVTVIRDGVRYGPLNVAESSLDGIVELMLGDRLSSLFPTTSAEPSGPIIMELAEVQCAALRAPLSLSLRQGEILGFVGQVGSGAVDLLQALAGAQPLTGGTVSYGGVPARLRDRRSAVRQGIGYCSPERKADGIFPMRKVYENLTAPTVGRNRGGVGTRIEQRQANQIAGNWSLAPGRLHSPVEELSGGNQQKVVLGKWTSRPLRALLLNEPTRGIDIGSRAEIYVHLRHLAEEGLCVIFASSEVEEVLGLADRIVTFSAGRAVRVVSAAEVTVADILTDVMSG